MAHNSDVFFHHSQILYSTIVYCPIQNSFLFKFNILNRQKAKSTPKQRLHYFIKYSMYHFIRLTVLILTCDYFNKFMQKQGVYQFLQGYNSTPDLSLASMYLKSPNNYSNSNRISFGKPLNGSNQEAGHSKLNKIKLKEGSFNFYEPKHTPQVPLNNTNVLSFSNSNHPKTQFIAQPKLLTQQQKKSEGIKKFQKIQKVSFSLPKRSYIAEKRCDSSRILQKYTKNPESSTSIAVNPNQASLMRQISFESNSNTNFDISQLNQKIKDMQSQLKFQQKYSNDLFRANEKLKQQMKQKDSNYLLEMTRIKSSQVQNNQMNAKIEQLTNQLSNVRNQLVEKIKKINEFERILSQKEQTQQNKMLQLNNKETKIYFLEQQLKQQQTKIQQLLAQKESFNQIYKNKLYQQRILKLNQQIANQHLKNQEIVLHKVKLAQEIEAKDQQILILNMQCKRKEPSNDQLQNKEVKNGGAKLNSPHKLQSVWQKQLQQNVNYYEGLMLNLKNQLEASNEKNISLSNSFQEKSRQLRNLKEQMKILKLKQQTEKKNLLLKYEQSMKEKESEIKILMNKINMLETRCGNLRTEVEQKDNFIQNYLLSRSINAYEKQSILQVFSKYKEQFIDKNRLISEQQASQTEESKPKDK